MIELIAGALVAAAALAYVLEPLGRPPGRGPEHSGRSLDDAVPTGEGAALVQHLRARLRTDCPRCQSPADPGALFCSSCGTSLIA